MSDRNMNISTVINIDKPWLKWLHDAIARMIVNSDMHQSIYQ
jgi:hypothetical protein